MTLIETERLNIRNLLLDDWNALQKIVIGYQESKYAKCDHQWPTSDEKIKEIVTGFSKADIFFAVVLKN